MLVFSPDLKVSAASAAAPATTHSSIKEAATGRRPPLWSRPKAASFMDERVVAVAAADVAETFKSGEKTSKSGENS